MISIPQTYVGLVNVVGDCYCFGLIDHLKPPTYQHIPVFVNVAGAASSVEALWAKLALGKSTLIVRDGDQPGLPLEPNDKGLYVRYQAKIAGLGIDHLLLVHRDLAEPTYPRDGQPTSIYSFWSNDEQGVACLGAHVRKAVRVAVFEAWFPFLANEGRHRGLIQPLVSYGSVQAVQVTLDPARWTAIITAGLKTGRLRLPA
jgi:hypothetical protein